MGGVGEIPQGGDGHERGPEDQEQVRRAGDARHAPRPADSIDVQQQHPDDLAEAEGGDGEVVAPQAQ